MHSSFNFLRSLQTLTWADYCPHKLLSQAGQAWLSESTPLRCSSLRWALSSVVFAACEVVLRRSAARRPTRAEVRPSHDASVVTPPLRFAKLCRYRVAESRAGGRRACESVFRPPHSPRERLKAGHREPIPRACTRTERRRVHAHARSDPRRLTTIHPTEATRALALARSYRW